MAWYNSAMNKRDVQKFERIFKGVSNHRRIAILSFINKNKNCVLDTIANALNCNIKTISEHTRKLVLAGLVRKRYEGRFVLHNLTPYGERIIDIIRTF